MKEFTKSRIQEKFIKWIKAFPESYNGYDMERFYDFILELKANDEWITEDELESSFRQEKGWNEELRKEISNIYYKKYLEIGSFIDFLFEKNIIKKNL